jgi:hypothetical protein
LGWQSFEQESKEETPQRLAGKLCLLIGGVLAVIGMLVWYDQRYPLFPTVPSKALISGLSRAGLVVIGGIMLWGGLAEARARVFWTWRGLFVLVLFGDIYTHAPEPNPLVPRGVMEPGLMSNLNTLGRVMDPLPRHGLARAMLSPQADHALRINSTSDPKLDYLANRQGLFSNLNLLDGIPKVNSFFPLFLRESHEVIRELYRRQLLPPEFEPLLDFLSVSHVTAPGKVFDWAKRPRALPMVTAGQEPMAVREDEMLSNVLSAQFDPRARVFV